MRFFTRKLTAGGAKEIESAVRNMSSNELTHGNLFMQMTHGKGD